MVTLRVGQEQSFLGVRGKEMIIQSGILKLIVVDSSSPFFPSRSSNML